MNEEEMNRFALGELTPEQARALAQRAQDDADLFDELTALSVGREGLSPRRRKKLVWPWVAIGAATAAAIVLTMVWPAVSRHSAQPATIAMVQAPAEPALLARPRDGNPTVFRGDGGTESRAPRSSGSVVSVEDGMATVDLGSLDGLAKGGQVDVIRNGQPAASIGLATIFRERARGILPARGSVRIGDQVRVPDAVFLGALLDEIDMFAAHNDSAGARRIAEQAAHLVADSAAADYADLNNLAVIEELRGDKAKAESLYRKALDAGPSGAQRKSIEANLARVKEAK